MSETHTVRGGIGQGTALETCVSDEELILSFEDAERRQQDKTPVTNARRKKKDKELAEAVQKAKAASREQNQRSRAIVEELRKEREAKEGGVGCKHPHKAIDAESHPLRDECTKEDDAEPKLTTPKPTGQTALFDF